MATQPLKSVHNSNPDAGTHLLILLAAALLLIVAAATAWGMDLNSLRADMATLTVWGIEAALVTLALGGIMIARPLCLWWGKRNIYIAGGLLIVAFAFTLMAPRTNRILFDEVIYENIAQSIALTGKASANFYANASPSQLDVKTPWVNKQPNGHPYLLSLFYRVFGVSETAPHWVGRLETAVTVVILFLTLTSLLRLYPPLGGGTSSGSSIEPVASALVLAVTPIAIWWGSTAASEPAAAMMNALAIGSAVIYASVYRSTELAPWRTAAGLLMAGALGGAFYFRQESPLVVAVAVFSLWIFSDSWKKTETYLWLALALVIATPQILHFWSVHTDKWGAKDGPRFGYVYLYHNLTTNLGYFWNGKWFPQFFSIFAVLGLGQAWRISRKILLWGLCWFLGAWGLFIIFYAGSYEYGSDSRYAVISCAPVALFAGFGVALIIRWLSAYRPLLILLGLLTALHWSSHAVYVTTIGKGAEESRKDVDFVRQHARQLPEKSLVISQLPFVWQVNGVSAGQIGTLKPKLNNMAALLQQYPGGVYLHWGYWQAQRAAFVQDARNIIAQCHGELLWCDAIGTYKYGIINLSTAWAVEHLGKASAPRLKSPGGDLESIFPRAYSVWEGKSILTHPAVGLKPPSAPAVTAPSVTPSGLIEPERLISPPSEPGSESTQIDSPKAPDPAVPESTQESMPGEEDPFN